MNTIAQQQHSSIPGPRRGGQRPWLKMLIMAAILVFAITGCAAAALALLRPSTSRSLHVRMTTDISRRNIALAEQIRSEGARHHLDIVMTDQEYGTLDALEEVDSPSEIKLALIVGGVTKRDYPHVRTVTSLTREYLHLLVKPELVALGIAGLRGKRIFLGPPATASHHVARDVLSFEGLRPTEEDKSAGYIFDFTSREQTLREMARIQSLGESARNEAIGKLPDAVVFLSPLPSPFARQLVTDFGYQLLPLPFAEAYGLDNLNPPDADGVQIDRSMMSPGVIPAYTYGRNPAVPVKECPTICFPLVLIAQDDVDVEAVSVLLKIIYDSPLRSVIHPPALNEQVYAFPRHAGTERYIHRNDAVLTPEVAARLGTVVGGTGAFVSGMIAFYGFLRLRNLNRFESYYREIGEIEMLAYGLHENPAAHPDTESLRTNLEGRLTALKCKVLEDFAEGGLKGEALMAGIVALINDTRASLAGMDSTRNGAHGHSTPNDAKPA